MYKKKIEFLAKVLISIALSYFVITSTVHYQNPRNLAEIFFLKLSHISVFSKVDVLQKLVRYYSIENYSLANTKLENVCYKEVCFKAYITQGDNLTDREKQILYNYHLRSLQIKEK